MPRMQMVLCEDNVMRAGDSLRAYLLQRAEANRKALEESAFQRGARAALERGATFLRHKVASYTSNSGQVNAFPDNLAEELLRLDVKEDS